MAAAVTLSFKRRTSSPVRSAAGLLSVLSQEERWISSTWKFRDHQRESCMPETITIVEEGVTK